jgi:Holliday junction resolvase
MINSRAKGGRGEREFAKWLRDYGYEARRSQQYCGVAGDADLITNIDNLHLEIKRVEKLNIEKAVQKAVDECGNNTPVVVHRRNRGEWLVTLRAIDYFKKGEA